MVAGFELLIEDEIDRNATELRFKTTGGGTVLNAKTGLAVKIVENNAININSREI